MNVRTLCLAILNFQEASGYEIKKLSEEGPFNHFVEISFGSIYPALSKLENEGMVTCKTEAQDGKPDRKVYSITASGRLEFINALNVAPQPDKFKSQFLLLTLNADIADRKILENAIDAHICQYETELAMMEEVVADCDQPAHIWTANYGRATLKAKLDYIKANKNQLLLLAGSSLPAEAAQ